MEYALILLNGILRRIDGHDKTHWKKWMVADRYPFKLSDVSAFLTRLLPALIGAWLVYQLAPWSWTVTAIAVWFGVWHTLSLQQGYEGWTEFSFKQITQHRRGMLGYLPVAYLSVEVAVLGIVACIVQGLLVPVFERLGFEKYKEITEFLAGIILLLPFVLL